MPDLQGFFVAWEADALPTELFPLSGSEGYHVNRSVSPPLLFRKERCDPDTKPRQYVVAFQHLRLPQDRGL